MEKELTADEIIMKNDMQIKLYEDILISLGKGNEVKKAEAKYGYHAPQAYSDVVKTHNGYVWVDSRLTIDHGYETMVFKSDENGNVENWSELDAAWYQTESDMRIGHISMCKKFGVENGNRI